MLKTVLKLTAFIIPLLSAVASFGHNDPVKKVGSIDKGSDEGSALISKKKLVKIVDSLLDLEVIDPKEVDLISYYNSLITTNNELRASELAHLNFYEEMELDEGALFPAKPEKDLPESLILEIENDNLGYYNAPISGVVTSYFGWREKRLHKGIDIDLVKGQPVVAAFDGKVRIAKANGGYGKVVIIMHANGLETVYAHLSKIKVKPGDVVLSGQPVGLGGSTGHSTGSHLHFEVRYKGNALNPATIISFDENKLLNESIVFQKSRYGFCAYPSTASFHVVERGENWSKIAKMYGLSQKELCALNGTQKRYALKVGQKIRID